MNTRTAARLIRALARLASLCYPARFRRRHREEFTAVADHLFERESTRRPPLGAVVETSRVLFADTMAASPAMWAAAITDDEIGTRVGPTLVRRAASFMGGMGHDLRLGVRGACRRPAFAGLVVATLGLGIGAGTAAFDALDRALLNPFPYPDRDRLVLLMMQDVKRGSTFSSPRLSQVALWRTQAETLSQIEIFREVSGVYASPAGAVVWAGVGVSGGLPGMLRVVPVAGRLITAADAAAGAPPVVMLSEQRWRGEFGADPSLIGRAITLGGKPMDVIGVWPDGARLSQTLTPDFIRPLPAGSEYSPGGFGAILGLMKLGRTPRDVERELAAITPPPAKDDPFVVTPAAVTPVRLYWGDGFVTGLWLVLTGALVLVATAIINTAHLLVERANRRRSELAMRLALGASRVRLVRLFAAEGLVFAAGGMFAGFLIALALEALITSIDPRVFLASAGAGLGGRAFGFAAALAVAASVASAAAPLLRAGRRDVTVAVGSGAARIGQRTSPLTAVFVGAQSALAVVLVFGAALLLHSFVNLQRVEVGVDYEHLAEVSISPPQTRYPTPDASEPFLRQVAESLRSIPGTAGVAVSGMPILQTSIMSGSPRLEDEPEDTTTTSTVTPAASVPANYFDVMGIRLVAGREFGPEETDVVVVTESFARRRARSVLGRLLYTPRNPQPARVIGIVRDVRVMGIANPQDGQPGIYFPMKEELRGFTRFIARTTDPDGFIAEARRRVAAIDRTVPILAPQTGLEVFRRQTSQYRLVSVLIGGLAVSSFLLAMGGVYGAVALGVVYRRREIGVRMALGAPAGRLVGRFVAAGLRPALIGAALGLLVIWPAAPYMEALLFRVAPHDPLSGAAGVALVSLTSTIAALVPARRVARIDPAITLRET